MSLETWLALALVLPFGGAVVVGLAGRRANLRDGVTVAVAVATCASVAMLAQGGAASSRAGIELFEVFPGAALAFEVEPLGLLFALVASGLWIVTSVYSFGYMRAHHEQNQTRFFVCFAIAIGAALGIAFARNLWTLFLFYELLTFSTYPLVTHHGTVEAMRAGRVYLGVLVSTSVGFFLLAILWTSQIAGTVEFKPGGILAGRAEGPVLGVLLALFAFGVGKAALMPFHRWLPAAMVAPTPVSALLHAVAVVKAGVFTIVKVIVYVFGIDVLAALDRGPLGAGGWLVWVASFTVIAASLVALFQDNLKRRLAYSTISQLAYIVLGAALANPRALQGASLHIVTHALAKITLFFCAGAIYVAAHKTEISDMKGIGRRMPVTMTAFLIASLSLIGLPPFAGAWSKGYLILGALDDRAWWVVAVLAVSSLLNIAYLLPVAINGFFYPPAGEGPHGIHEAPLACVVPLALTAIGCFGLFLFIDPWLALVQRIG